MALVALSCLIFGLMSIQTSEAIECYQCADTTIISPCYTGFYNESLMGINDVYKKDCEESNPQWDRCVIEWQKDVKGSLSYIKRGCHDGKTFNKFESDPSFYNLSANNQSTCAFTGTRQICFIFCNMSNFCNGPEETNSTDNNFGVNLGSSTTLLPLLLLTVAMVWVCNGNQS